MRIFNVGLKGLLASVLLFSAFGQSVQADEALSATNLKGIETENVFTTRKKIDSI